MAKMGIPETVANPSPKVLPGSSYPCESVAYIALHIQDDATGKEFPLLLTPNEMTKKALYYEIDKIAKRIRLGHMIAVPVPMDGYVIRVKYDGKDQIMRITKTVLTRATKRAEAKPSLIPKKGFFADLLD